MSDYADSSETALYLKIVFNILYFQNVLLNITLYVLCSCIYSNVFNKYFEVFILGKLSGFSFVFSLQCLHTFMNTLTILAFKNALLLWFPIHNRTLFGKWYFTMQNKVKLWNIPATQELHISAGSMTSLAELWSTQQDLNAALAVIIVMGSADRNLQWFILLHPSSTLVKNRDEWEAQTLQWKGNNGYMRLKINYPTLSFPLNRYL